MALRSTISPLLRHTISPRISPVQRLRFSASTTQYLDAVDVATSPVDAGLNDILGSSPEARKKNRWSKAQKTTRLTTKAPSRTEPKLVKSSIPTPAEPSRELADPEPAVVTGQQTLLPYHISRTPANNLPVYTDIRNGSTRKETIIRKITGDPKPLRDALVQYLAIDDERVWVGKVTGHVYIKGHHKPKVDQFLKEHGF